MADLLPNVPKVPSGSWSELAARMGREIAANRPRPSANIDQIFKQAESTDIPRYIAEVSEKLGKIHDDAKLRHGGEGPYPVEWYVPMGEYSPIDVSMSASTPDEFLASVYGDDYPKVRDAMLAAHGSMNPSDLMYAHYKNLGGMDKAMSRRVFEVNRPEGAGGNSGALPLPGLIEYSADQEKLLGAKRQGVRDHEWRHVVSPVLSKSPVALPDKIDPAASHSRYTNSETELAANLGSMMGLEYGITGKPIITPEQRIQAVKKWMEGRPKPNPNPSGMFDAFGPDPTIEHGPRAGQPAAGYEFMRNTLQKILPVLEPEKKRAVIKAMGTFGSTEPSQEMPYV